MAGESEKSVEHQLPLNSGAPRTQQKLQWSNVLDWNFDIFQLEETESKPLVWLGMKIFSAFDAFKYLKIDEVILRNWLSMIEEHYHVDNPYHNATHAADVLQAVAYYLNSGKLDSLLDPLEKVGCLIAAIIHDTDHPGRNNGFLINTNHPLALLYNDRSVLESHHAALAFRLTLENSNVNIFQNVDTAVYRALRESIVDMVLATDMAHHKTHVTNFKNALNTLSPSSNTNSSVTKNDPTNVGGGGGTSNNYPKQSIDVLKRMLIKCADVSNPARPLKLALEWADRITEEFCRQTDEEISRNLPLTLPAYNRTTCSLPSTQLGFCNFFLTDLYKTWHDFTNVPEPMRIYKMNYDFWKNLESKQIRSSEEVHHYLATPNSFDSDESS